jgi:gamma-glutamylcyclotransferase
VSNLYFAYGSNMSRARLQARIPTAQSIGAAWMDGWRLACNKRGVDGTGKANLVSAVGFQAWGVLYRLDDDHWETLDTFEPGYVRSMVKVNAYKGQQSVDLSKRESAQIYLATNVGSEIAPADWYREHLLIGAREHDLPEEIIRQIETLAGR